jgi:hypothetical protein
MTRRILYSAAVLAVVLLSCGIRLYAAGHLDVDYDEPVYLGAAVDYARSMRAGDLKQLAWSENTYEHPALYKILYGVVLLSQPPLDRLPDKDLPRLAPIATAAAGSWNVAARHLSVLLGTLAVLAMALINPLAGLFLGIDTLSVKYTSEVYLEALPLLTSLLCGLAYVRWVDRAHEPRTSRRPPVLWLILSALFLVSTLGIGLLISTIARTQFEAMLLAFLIQLPAIFLSGFFFPLAAMPPFLQALSYLVPLRYFLIIVRSIVIKGVGLTAVLPEVIALAIFGLVVMGIAARRFHKRLD